MELEMSTGILLALKWQSPGAYRARSLEDQDRIAKAAPKSPCSYINGSHIL